MAMARPPRRDEGEEDVDEEEEGDATALVTIVRLLPEEDEAAEPEASRLWGIARERCIARERVELRGRGIQLERLQGRMGEQKEDNFFPSPLFFFENSGRREALPAAAASAFSSQPRPPVFFSVSSRFVLNFTPFSSAPRPPSPRQQTAIAALSFLLPRRC